VDQSQNRLCERNRMGVLAIQIPDVLREEQLQFTPAEDRLRL
jgi:hypothetical protein